MLPQLSSMKLWRHRCRLVGILTELKRKHRLAYRQATLVGAQEMLDKLTCFEDARLLE